MADAPQTSVCRVDCTAQILGKPISCVDIVLVHTANSPGAAVIQRAYQPNESKQASIQRPDLQTVLTQMGASQSAMFTTRTTPDSNLFIRVRSSAAGVADTFVNMDGFLVAPTYHMAWGGLAMGEVILEKSAVLAGFDSTIYVYGGEAYNSGSTGIATSIIGTDELTSPNLAARLMAILKWKMKGWEDTRAIYDAQTKGAQQLKNAIHERNAKILPFLEEALKASNNPDAVIPGLGGTSGTFNDLDIVQVHINEFISGMLASGGQDFWSVLQILATHFQMMYVAEPGTYGHFIPYADVVGANPQRVAVALDVRNVSIQLGGQSLLPVTSAVVCSPTANDFRPTVTPDSYARGPMGFVTRAVYPKSDAAGIGLNIQDPGPAWLPLNGGWVSSHFAGGEEVTMDLTQYKAGSGTLRTVTGKSDDAVLDNVLQQWAENVYTFNALAGSSLSCTVPLDFRFVPGKFYTVWQEGGVELFSGFLHTVVHSINTAKESARADSMLQFQFVRARGFTLKA